MRLRHPIIWACFCEISQSASSSDALQNFLGILLNSSLSTAAPVSVPELSSSVSDVTSERQAFSTAYKAPESSLTTNQLDGAADGAADGDSGSTLPVPTSDVTSKGNSLADLLGALFELPRRPTEPTESGLDLLTTEAEEEAGVSDGVNVHTFLWQREEFPEQNDLQTLIRQNIYSNPAPYLNLLMEMASLASEVQNATRRRLESSALSSLDLSSGTLTGNTGGGSADSLNSGSDSSAGSVAGSVASSVLNPSDILTVLGLVNSGVSLGTEVITGQTTTPSPVQQLASGIQSIVAGARDLNSVFTRILNLAELTQTTADNSVSSDGSNAAATTVR